MSTPRNWPSSANWPTAGGIRTANSGRCTRSTRCAWTGSTAWPRWPASRCSTSAAAAASWPKRWPRARAQVTGIDLAAKPLGVARLHALEAGVANVEYREIAAEALAAEQPGGLRRRHLHGDARARARPGVDRARLRRAGPARRLGVLLDAEPQPEVLPVRHRRRRVRAAACCRGARTSTRASSARANWRAARATPACELQATRGMEYNPLTRRYWLSGDTSVNYLVACRRPA